MCVNDVLTSGAEPLFFLDYLATGKLNPEQLQQVVSGISQGCQQAGCALLGGETAEMPGFYQQGEYQLLDGSQVQLGDVAIALASQGVHSNGYSLVRKIVASSFDWSYRPQLLQGKSLGEAFLTPTQIYVKPVLAARKAGLEIHGMAHITGGGIPENLPRCLGAGQSIRVNPNSWSIPPIFEWLATAGPVSPTAMFNTFNMGIGYVLIVPPSSAAQTIQWFQSQGMDAYAIAQVISGSGVVEGLPE